MELNQFYLQIQSILFIAYCTCIIIRSTTSNKFVCSKWNISKYALNIIIVALLTIGMAEKLGIQTGDTVTIRDPDLRSLTLTVSGIYDNNVYNYIWCYLIIDLTISGVLLVVEHKS